MNTSFAPGRGVIWSGITTSPRTATVLLRDTVFSGRIFGVLFGGPGYGSVVGGMFSPVLGGSTLGGFCRICSIDGPAGVPNGAGALNGPAGAGGKNPEAGGQGGGQTGWGGK